jgi:hypothetical protein
MTLTVSLSLFGTYIREGKSRTAGASIPGRSAA